MNHLNMFTIIFIGDLLHKTSHKSPNIKSQKFTIHLKMSKKVIFFVLIKINYWGEFFMETIVF